MIRQIIQRLRRAPSTTPIQQVVAIYLQPERVKLLWLSVAEMQVSRIETLAVTGAAAWEDALEGMCDDITGTTPICLVLPASCYQLFLVDRPTVPDAELTQALPWLLQEMVEAPVQDFVIDYLQLPDTQNQTSKLQLVAAQKVLLHPLCQLLQRRGKRLSNIQPEEWLMRNVLTKQSQPTLLLSQQPDHDVVITIVQDGMLYFTRKLRGYHRLADYGLDELYAGVLDNLMLEIQRSMDYFEGQLRQPPIRDLKLLLPEPVQHEMQEHLTRNGFGQVQVVNLAQWMGAFSAHEQVEYWPALAAALELMEVADETAR